MALVVATGTNALPYVTSAYSQNFVSAFHFTGANVPHAQTQSAANEVCVAAVAAVVQGSGIFRVDCHVSFGDNTTAKTVSHQLQLIPFTSPSSFFTGGQANGIVTFGSNVTPKTASQWVSIINSDAAGVTANGISFNGTPLVHTVSGTMNTTQRQVDTLTGLLTNKDYAYDFSGIIWNQFANGGTGGGWTTNTYVVAALTLNSTSGGDVVTYGDITMSIDER